MKVSTRGDYAARALLSLALHGSEQPTSVKEIAERTGLPQPYLEQILLAGHCILQEVWVGVSDETRQILERFTLADLVDRTRIGHPDAASISGADVQVAEAVES